MDKLTVYCSVQSRDFIRLYDEFDKDDDGLLIEVGHVIDDKLVREDLFISRYEVELLHRFLTRYLEDTEL